MFVHLLMLTLFACPDPTTAADLGNPGPGGAAPGAAGGPQPATDGPPPAPGNFNVEAGTGVTITGTLAYAGNQEGQLRLDFLVTEEDAPPRLLHIEKLDAFGSYAVSTPPNTGSVAIVAFVDVAGDGPSPSDPAGMIRIEIDDANIEGADIELSDAPDLGDLTPGDAAPTDAPISQDGSAPTEPEVSVGQEVETDPASDEVIPTQPSEEPAKDGNSE